MSDQEKAMRARVEGRIKTEQITAWQLRIGDFTVRCLRVLDSNEFVVQMYVTGSGGPMNELARSDNPTELLIRTATGVRKLIDTRTKEIIQ